jgi:predicted lipid-binding transport protein (Tim44 family)
MKRQLVHMLTMAIVVAALSVTALQTYAEARAGGGRSMGSRGTRSYSRPVSPSSQPQMAPQPAPRPMTPPPLQQPQPAGGGFFRSMAGGLVGGMLGGMLFRGLGLGGGWGGGVGGSGIGLFEILLLAGIAYLIYRMVKGRRQQATVSDYQNYSQSGGYDSQAGYQAAQPAAAMGGGDLATGLAHIRQMDSSFSEERFGDQVMDMFFKIQAAWMNRDLTPVAHLLTEEMRRIFQEDMDRLRREQRINRLENIAVRNVEIVEAWQEQGEDYLTTQIYANLLDYTTDEGGRLVSGSNTEPVKFEEYWTFTRPVGGNGWRLSAIDQK